MARLAADRLLPGESDHIELVPIERLGERSRGRVADRQSAAVGGDPIGIGDAHARGGAVPGEHDVGRRIGPGEIGEFAVSGLEHRHVLELKLLDDVGDPAFAEGFPGQHGHRPRTEQRPQRHFDRAGIGGRHDGDAVVGGDLKNFAGQIERALELRPARLGAMRASEKSVLEGLRAPAGALGAGAGRKMRHRRPHGRHRERHDLSFQIGAPRWGGVSRGRR